MSSPLKLETNLSLCHFAGPANGRESLTRASGSLHFALCHLHLGTQPIVGARNESTVRVERQLRRGAAELGACTTWIGAFWQLECLEGLQAPIAYP